MALCDLADFAMAYGWQTGPGMFALIKGTYQVNAATDDGVVHLAWLTIRTPTDMALHFGCRMLLVDGTLALPHLRGIDEDVSCMACVTRTAS